MAGPMDLVGPGVATDYRATGPIAGVLAAQQIQDAQDAQGRSFRDSDLAYQLKQHEYEQALANDPVTAAKRQLDLAQMGSEQKAWDNGTNEDIAAAQRSQKLAEAIAGKDKNELNSVQAKANKFLATVNEMEPPDRPGAAVRNKELWDTKVYPTLVANGMAKGIPKEYDPAVTHQVLQSRSEAAIQTSEMIQKTKLQELENKGKTDVATISADASRYAADNAGVRAAQVAATAGAKEDANTQLEKGILEKAFRDKEISKDEFGTLVQIQKDKYRQDPNIKGMYDTLVNDWNITKGSDERKTLAAEAHLPENADANDYASKKIEAIMQRKAERDVHMKLGAQVQIGGTSTTGVKTPASTVTVPQPRGGSGDVPPAPRGAGGKSPEQLTQEGWHWKQGSKGWGWYK